MQPSARTTLKTELDRLLYPDCAVFPIVSLIISYFVSSPDEWFYTFPELTTGELTFVLTPTCPWGTGSLKPLGFDKASAYSRSLSLYWLSRNWALIPGCNRTGIKCACSIFSTYGVHGDELLSPWVRDYLGLDWLEILPELMIRGSSLRLTAHLALALFTRPTAMTQGSPVKNILEMCTPKIGLTQSTPIKNILEM